MNSAAETREKLIQAAGRLFARSESPETVSLREIAKEAGVNPAMIRYCFGDKAGLIIAVCRLCVIGQTGAPVSTYLECHRAELADPQRQREFLDGLLEMLWQHFSRENGAWLAKLPLLALQDPLDAPHRRDFIERCFKPDVAAFAEIYRTITGARDPDSAYCCFLSILLPIAVVAGQKAPIPGFSLHCRISDHFNRLFLSFCKKTLRNQLQVKEECTQEPSWLREL